MTTEREHHGHFDYIIVGGGSAGCLLANRLTQDKKKQVLLIEAGGKDDYHWIHIPVGYLHCIDNPRTDWRYRTAPESALHGRSLLYPRGRVLGGSSSINGMIYMRGQAADYDQWAEMVGDARWRWDNLLPVFKGMEDHHGGANDYHGTGGEWRVEKQRLSWQILDAFSQAAQQTGIPATDDFNRGDNHGVGYFEVNQKGGFRWNTAKAFIRPIAKRNNLHIITGSQVEKLLFEDAANPQRCTGVHFFGGGIHHTAELEPDAHCEVILSAGSIGSVQILELSGIGQAARLQALGIPVKQDLPGVGENLQDHLQLRMVFKVKHTKTLNTLSKYWWGKLKIGVQYLLTQSGPMSMAPSQLGAFAKSSPAQARANLEYHVQPLSLEKFGEPLHRFNAFTASVCDLQPTSRGSVHIQSADFLEAPLIAPNYLTTDADKKTAVEALRLTRQIASQSALQRYQLEELKPGPVAQTDAELLRAAGDIGTTIFHPAGTCKMGRADDPMAVVDSELKVRGLANVRVVDASVMPTLTSGNTNAPVLVIAELASQWIRSAK